MSKPIRKSSTREVWQREFKYETASAATIAYRDRVYADGGIINNPLLVEYAFQTIALLTSNISRSPLRVTWIDASFGVKIDTSNRILKAYDLFGLNDWVQTVQARQPILKQDTNSVFYMFTDGIDDYLWTENVVNWGTNKLSHIFVCQYVNSHACSYFINNSTVNLGMWYQIYDAGGTVNAIIYDGNANERSTLGYTGRMIIRNVIDGSLSATSKMQYYKNNIISSSVTNGNYTSNFVTDRLVIGGRIYQPVFNSMNFYGNVLFKEALSSANTKLLADFYNRIHNTY